MEAKAEGGVGEQLKVLVAIASYGLGNDSYLERITHEYHAMPFAVDIVILSNVEKALPRTECRVGLPTKNPWSLPFAHKRLFAERRSDYDLFIYSEDDILISERNLRAWLEVNAALAEDEVAGFLRTEVGPDGDLSYPDANAWYHWEPASVRRRNGVTLAFFTNEHAACYALTRAQLGRALNSGGFDVPPHEGEYDLLCTAATDVYTQCGLKKLIPISRLDDFSVHHMSNRYYGKMGVKADEFVRQTAVLMQVADGAASPRSLLTTQTRLRRTEYSKIYYEPVRAEITKLIPSSARSVLSIGCGSGATEMRLAEKGLRVAAIPLDHVIAAGAAEAGVEMIDGDFRSARETLANRKFDAILLLNLLHLAPDPVEVLSLFSELLAPGAPMIIQSPNMRNLATAWRRIRRRDKEMPWDFSRSGAHFACLRRIADWCGRAGVRIEATTNVLHRRVASYESVIPTVARRAFSTEIIAVAKQPRIS